MKRFLTLLLFLAMCYFGLAGCTGGGSGGDSGTTLQTEPVETPPDGGDEEIPIHNLFASEPGTMVSMSALTGTVDPVGTNIVDDFDGDGLVNSKETTGNVWVADYPHIGASISTPVTMRIEILYNSETSSKELSSEIMAEDTENTKVNSSDVVHRKEVNNRTVQFQDRILTTSSQSLSIGARRIDGFKRGRIAANIKTAGIGSVRTKGATSLSNSYTDTTDRTFTDWVDKPFKNDVDAEGWAQKDNSKSKRAKQLRTEYRTVSDTSKKIKPNSGYVRASLYITNNTVNMPVKLTNILCSFMLENSDGKLLPVQSFRLRNDDYSLFELNLYGDKTFGPYVIELANLNTQEIKDAIAKGYNPRIFLVDYQMEHVPDSNYRTALSGSFSGNNLKIVEENAKGRTAGIKLVYPGDRQFFRVTAFDTDGVESRTGSIGATTFSPGVSLEKALNRITYSGVDIQYADIVFDMSGMDPEFSIPRFHIRTIKSINGEEMKLPFPVVDSVPYKTIAGNHVDKDGISLGGSSTAYLVKPIGEWTDQEIQDFKVWAVFENGRYYLHTGDVLSTGDIPTYFEYQIPGQTAVRVPMVKGIQSMIWPGDHYDIVCLEFEEQEEETQVFGSNPLETGEALSFNTKWNLDTIEEFPFQPDAGSAYLGEAILGDTIEFSIKLNQTRYLNPDFGTPDTTTEPGKRIYQAFSYDLDRPVVTRKFEIDEAVDFEISFGLGGQYKHWTNLVDPINRSPSSIYTLDVSDRNWNYLDQEFTIRVPIPMNLDGVGPDGTVKIFIRPARNNAYRESVWPLPYTEVKQFRGTLFAAANTGATQIEVTDTVGTAYVNDTLYLDGYGYQINSVDIQTDKTVLTFATTLQSDNAAGADVFVNLSTNYPEPIMQIEVDDGFESAWNLANPDSSTDNGDAFKPLTLMDQDLDSPVNFLGYYHNQMETNWLGHQIYSNPYWNQWTDSSKFKPQSEKFESIQTAGSNRMSVEYSNFDARFLLSGGENLVSTDATNDQEYPKLASYGNKALAVWQSKNASGDYDIRGRVIDLTPGNEGALLGSEIAISSNNVNTQKEPQVSVINNKAIVTWLSDDVVSTIFQVKGRVIDLSNGSEGQFLSPEFLVNTTLNLSHAEPRLATANNKAIVVWWLITPSFTYEVEGQIVDLSTGNEGALINSKLSINTNNTDGQYDHEVAALGNKAFVVWHSSHSGKLTIQGQIIDLASGNEGEFLGAEKTINSTNVYAETYPHVIVHNEKALVTWKSYANSPGTLIDIKGQVVNLSSGFEGELIGSETILDTNNTGMNNVLLMEVVGNKAFVAWKSHDAGGQNQIEGRTVNLETGKEGETIGSTLLIDPRDGDESNLDLTSSDGRVFVVYTSNTLGPGNDIMGQIIDLTTGHEGRLIGSPVLISINRTSHQANPSVVNNQGVLSIIWESMDNEVDYDIKSQVMQLKDDLLDENLNYFKAPLLERDYEVKARIVEELQ